LFVVSGCLAVTPGGLPQARGAIGVAFPDQQAERREADYLRYDRYRQELLGHGIDASLYRLPLEVSRLKGFNVLVYGGWYSDSTIRTLDPETRKRAAAERAALEGYVRAGGGLIILPMVRRYPGQAIDEYYNLVLEGFGAQVLKEGAWDPEHNFTGPGTLAFPPLPYFTTTRVSQHPVTDGVKQLALPRDVYRGGPPGVAALAYDGSWTVVVTGEASAGSYGVDAGFRLDPKQPGTYRTAPPVTAVRTFGQGRVFSYPLHLAYVSLNFGHPAWPQTVETRGDVAAGRPSDSQKMILNAMRWVAEPSQRLPGFGQREKPAARPVWWDEAVHLPRLALAAYRPQEPHRGILGAHTALSDGRGTVEEYARAGTAAGLQFIAFAEALEDLSPENWQTLVRQCREVSQKGGIYLLPGYEYTDVNGARWAVWGEQVRYPRPNQWAKDRKRVFRDGELEHDSNLPARMLLTYDKLPGDPGNMWWYYQVPVWVYDENELVADNLDQYLLAQDNLYAVSAACFTRIRSPEGVAAAAWRCTLNAERRRYPSVRPAVNTSLSQWTPWTYVSQGGEMGPKLEWADSIHTGSNVYRTRGAQRWRGAFVARSDAGLKEVRVHDGTSGPVRRYLCHGATEFRRVLEVALDRQHYLALEAVDVNGRRAVYSAVRLFFYGQGLYRCGDNLNILGSTPTVAHPDRHQFPRFALMEDMDLLTLRGFDTGVGLFNQPSADLSAFAVRTRAGRDGYQSLPRTEEDTGGRLVQVPTRFPYASYEVSVAQARSDRYVKRPVNDFAHGPFLPRERALKYATIDRRVYMLRSRMDYATKWGFWRPHEAAEAYLGDAFVHEGSVTFTQDVTLEGDVPVELERVEYRGGSAYGEAERVLVGDADRGALEVRYDPEDRHRLSGTLSRGGYIAGEFTEGGTLAVVPAVEGLRYRVETLSTGPRNLKWAYTVGLGRPGQAFKKGDTLRYRYLAVSLSGRAPRDDRLLMGLGQAFGIGPPQGVQPFRVDVGSARGSEVFFTGQAKDNELVVRFNPWPLLVNRPLRVEGVKLNGCAAVYVLDGTPWEQRFRYVGVFEGAALFQQNTDRGAMVWVGNPFYAGDEQLRLTLVADGLAAGEAPFLEVHNPTDRPVTTVLRSPPHTPRYGGFVRNVKVPAGDSVFVPLPTSAAKDPRR
jgi:hypothetical protein